MIQTLRPHHYKRRKGKRVLYQLSCTTMAIPHTYAEYKKFQENVALESLHHDDREALAKSGPLKAYARTSFPPLPPTLQLSFLLSCFNIMLWFNYFYLEWISVSVDNRSERTVTPKNGVCLWGVYCYPLFHSKYLVMLTEY